MLKTLHSYGLLVPQYMNKYIVTFLLFAAVFFSAPLPAHQDPEIAGYVPVDGGRIWYRLNGAEHLGKTPAIIVIHGGPGGTHRGNMPYVALSDKYPVILYDQLGTGNSDHPGLKENWKTERFVAEIDHIRKALNLKEVIIAGHSWGGTLAAEYAVRRPDGLKAAILSSPLISTHQWNTDNQDWVKEMPKDVQQALKEHEAAGTLDHPDYQAASKAFYALHMCRKDPCSNKSYRDDGPNSNKVMYEYMWGVTDFRGTGTLKDYDVSPQLPNINVPTLMICGEFDEARPRSCKKYANMISDAKFVVVPNAGHATLSESEDFYLKAVRGFIEQSLLMSDEE